MVSDEASRCPLCGGDNRCGYQSGDTNQSLQCWCQQQPIPSGLKEQLPPDVQGSACICQGCLQKYRNLVEDAFR